MFAFYALLALWLVFPVACIALASAINAVLASGSYATIRAHLATITHAARTEEQVREAMDRASEFFALARMAELRADTVRAHDARACGDRALASALALRAGVSLSLAGAVVTANASNVSAHVATIPVNPEATSSHAATFAGDNGVEYLTATSLTYSDDSADDTIPCERPAFAEATRAVYWPSIARISDAQVIALCDSGDYATSVARIAGINRPAVPEATVSVKSPRKARKATPRKARKVSAVAAQVLS